MPGGTRMFVALVRFILGFIAAALVAGVVQVLFVAGLDGIRSQGLGLIDNMGMLSLLAATQTAVFALPFAILGAIMAGWLSVRSRFYFIGVGLLIGLGGFFAQHVGESGLTTILNRYALAAYATSGLVGGFVYWLAGVQKRPAKPLRRKVKSAPAPADEKAP